MTRITLRDDQVTAVLWADAIRAPGVAPLIIPYGLQFNERGQLERRPLVGGYHSSLTRRRAEDASEPKQPELKTEQTTRRWESWAHEGVWQRGGSHVQPEAWAVPPGRLGVVVVDVDDPDLLPELLELYGETPVWVLSPSGGTHLYYQAPEGPPPPSRTGVRGHHTYDIKADGGTIHAPGSRHHRCPGAYTADAPGVVDGALRRGRKPLFKASELWHAMPVFPQFVADEEWDLYHPPLASMSGEEHILAGTPDERKMGARYLAAAGPAVAGSGGHDHTRKLILKLGDLGFPKEIGSELLHDWNRTCEPPWSQRDLDSKIEHYYQRRGMPIGWRAYEMGLVDDDESGAPDEEDAADDVELASHADEIGMLARMVRS